MTLLAPPTNRDRCLILSLGREGCRCRTCHRELTTPPCGAPGRLYPVTPADQARLTAGPAKEKFFTASMEGRCSEHAQNRTPAAYFATKTVPCDYVPWRLS
jgi:hypothetical protein